jgi:hypothetical protein
MQKSHTTLSDNFSSIDNLLCTATAKAIATAKLPCLYASMNDFPLPIAADELFLLMKLRQV